MKENNNFRMKDLVMQITIRKIEDKQYDYYYYIQIYTIYYWERNKKMKTTAKKQKTHCIIGFKVNFFHILREIPIKQNKK